jgi:hypothetical protein
VEIAVAAALTSIPPLILAVWRDLRNRTNGSGPLAQKLDCIEGRLVRMEERVVRVEERLAQ